MQIQSLQLKKKLDTVVQRYLEENPPEEPVFRLTSTEGFQRNRNYRYLLDARSKFSDIPLRQYIYFHGKLVVDEPGEKRAFYVNPYGPIEIYLNGELVYRSSILEETDPQQGTYFQAELTEKENSVVIAAKNVKTGCGCEFGTANPKRDPFCVLGPSQERAHVEGWLYSAPQKEKWSVLPSLDESEGSENFWLPKIETTENMVSALLYQSPGQFVYSRVEVRIPASDYYSFEGLKESTEVYLKDQEGTIERQIYLEKGDYQVLFKVCDKEENLNKLQIWGQKQKEGILSSIFGIKDRHPFCYIGPVEREDGYFISRLFSRHLIQEGLYWMVNSPKMFVRPFLETALFGRWNYPLGVTLNGLLNYAVQYQNHKVLDYVKRHVELCTKYYEYSIWDRDKFGAPAINYSLAIIDSLDDCGSFGYTLQRVMQQTPIEGGKKVTERVAYYIRSCQHRATDGSFYRINSHISLMEETLWADDVYMSIPFLLEYYKSTEEEEVLIDVLRQLKQFFEHLYIPEKKLLSHVYNLKFNENTGIPWGRGNGWYFLSLSLVLEEIQTRPNLFQELLPFYEKLEEGYLASQGRDGMWHQLLDDETSYPETSCTAMMLFVLCRSKKFCWTDSHIRLEPLLAAWEVIDKEMIDEKGNLLGVCRGSGYSFDSDYYKYDLLPRKNDTHGIGIVLTAGCELDSLLKEVDETGYVE